MDQVEEPHRAARATGDGFDASAMSIDLERILSSLQRMRANQDTVLSKLAAQRVAGEHRRAERSADRTA
jgi:hypothetical protein